VYLVQAVRKWYGGQNSEKKIVWDGMLVSVTESMRLRRLLVEVFTRKPDSLLQYGSPWVIWGNKEVHVTQKVEVPNVNFHTPYRRIIESIDLNGSKNNNSQSCFREPEHLSTQCFNFQ
jgi:hypothetical protein